MHRLAFIVFLAVASAAPQYFHHHQHTPLHSYLQMNHHPPYYSSEDYFGNRMFDTRRFWAELAQEMMSLDQMLQEFYNHFPKVTSEEGFQNGQYKISIPLSGFTSEDVVVKVKNHVVMVQAIHKADGGHEKHYVDIRTVPANVDVTTGTYIFENEVLNISFKVKGDIEEAVPVTEGSTVETEKEHSREEMEPHSDDTNEDENVDMKSSSDKEIISNEIPTHQQNLEATTYSVLKNDDVEFVPVPY